MDFKNKLSAEILLPEKCRQAIVDHCQRKISGEYINGEAEDKKAFGLVAGTRSDMEIKVARCLPLLKNARNQEPFKEFLDRMLTEYAIPSETPLKKRGWVADPDELSAAIDTCRQDGLQLLGTYHMHRVAWQHDPLRETPTKLDTVLAENSRLFMFIVSMVDPQRPIIRAFFEGLPDQELPVVISGDKT